MDYFIFNGDINRGIDLDFMDFISSHMEEDEVMLLLVTRGGSPDAAYKMGRYLQSRYDSVSVLVPGFCKSAGTLLAISANELVFSPYGELGPLDVQLAKTDNLQGFDSGLNISEAFMALEKRAKETFHDLIMEIIGNSDGIVSFQTASHSASEIVSSLYGPIFGRIDPEEVGSRARAMRIGEDYGKRLNGRFANLKPGALDFLSQTYSSHGFVIDMQEAAALFERTREVNDIEKKLVDKLGKVARVPQDRIYMDNLKPIVAEIVGSGSDSVDEETADGASGKGVASEEGSAEASGIAINGSDPAGASAA